MGGPDERSKSASYLSGVTEVTPGPGSQIPLWGQWGGGGKPPRVF